MATTASTGLALTTKYTPPATCSDIITQSGDLFWQGGVMQTGDVDCFPPGFSKIFLSAYSPGICPYGWTSVASLTQESTAVSDAMCCPR